MSDRPPPDEPKPPTLDYERRDEDTEAILRRRKFLIMSALGAAGAATAGFLLTGHRRPPTPGGMPMICLSCDLPPTTGASKPTSQTTQPDEL